MFLLLLKECAVFKRQPASAKGRNSISISRIYMFAGKLISQLQSERMWNWEDNLLFAYTFLSKCDEAAFPPPPPPPPPSRHFPNSKPLLRTFLAIIPLLLLLLPARFSLERHPCPPSPQRGGEEREKYGDGMFLPVPPLPLPLSPTLIRDSTLPPSPPPLSPLR